MIIVFEGQDGVGKTTLFKALAKARNYKDTYIDRMFISDLVYANERKDHETISEKTDELRSFNNWLHPFYVLIEAENKDVEKTLREKGEYKDYFSHGNQFRDIFDSYLKKYPLKIRINRTGKSIEKCVEEIQKNIEKLKEQYSFYV